MRAIVQRVARASVSVDSTVHSEIGKGLCVLLGITHSDTDDDTEWVVRKLLSLRVWPNDKGKEWAANVTTVDGGQGAELLVVSQFTLYAKVNKGNKPDFHNAMPAAQSKVVYEDVLARLRQGYRADAVKDCVFGAMMDVELVNDGPVTLVLDSNQRDPVVKPPPEAAGTSAVETGATAQDTTTTTSAAAPSSGSTAGGDG
eukprot:m.203435 g.203435  ORF g.203435 m.203435 type:complete len:200 (-) comp22126_c0_seq1:405-1004(-)